LALDAAPQRGNVTSSAAAADLSLVHSWRRLCEIASRVGPRKRPTGPKLAAPPTCACTAARSESASCSAVSQNASSRSPTSGSPVSQPGGGGGPCAIAERTTPASRTTFSVRLMPSSRKGTSKRLARRSVMTSAAGVR
jgi:hypothetical protein